MVACLQADLYSFCFDTLGDDYLSVVGDKVDKESSTDARLGCCD